MTDLLHIAKEAALTAGKKILTIYDTADFAVDFKEDDSPLTIADKEGHNEIVSFLEKTKYPILSEEGKSISFKERKKWETYWCIDPLDGTKEFIKRNGEFTVNIALITNGVPVLGVVYVPVLKKIFWGIKGKGSFLEIDGVSNELKLKSSPKKLEQLINESGLRIVASRSHLTEETEEFISGLKTPSTISMGSSLKFLVIAEAKADIYPRFAPTMEWDTAAAHAILLGLNYAVLQYPSLKPLNYNKENLLNPWFIVF